MNQELKLLLSKVKSLPYGRNSNRADYTLVPIEKKGSCSTKHAYIQGIANNNGWKNVRLMLCIYMMTPKNTAAIAPVLNKYKLKKIPEAHTYLEIDGNIIDVTGLADSETSFETSIIHKEEIQPNQIGDYKINWHKQFLIDWAESTNYTAEELWAIREECIHLLSIA